ncbi:MAG: phosphodiester glycosidase family protein [Actinomycetota bacterium]
MRTEAPLRSVGRSLRLVLVGVVASLLGAGGALWSPVHAQSAAGYQLDEARVLAPGVEYQRLVRSDGPVVAHVVRVQQSSPSVRQQTVPSNRRSEQTSQMCQRVGCIAAINGDFYQPSTGEPVGGIAHAGRTLLSPVPHHDQLSVSAAGGLAAGPVTWSGSLSLSGLGELKIDALNRKGAVDGVTLYTPDYGAATPATSSSAELVLRTLDLPLSLGPARTGLVELVTMNDGSGGTAIPPDGVVLAGKGTGTVSVRELWQRSKGNLLGSTALFQLQTSPALFESIGGGPILLKGGQVAVPTDGSSLVAGRHPRTMVGWNQTHSFLVAVDGRQPGYSTGLTLVEAANFLAGLGATEGINLDGGGSSTLVLNGAVVNRPSDRLVLRGGSEQVVAFPRAGDMVVGPVERPVANAMAVVGAPQLSLLEGLVGPDLLNLPPGVGVAGPRQDPASRP